MRIGSDHTGFTLIELLVVVLVMAIGMSVVAGMASWGRDPAQVEATRLATLLEHASLRARTTGTPLRWQGRGDAYHFSALGEDWKDIADSSTELLRPRKLAANVIVSQSGSAAIQLPSSGLAPRFSLELISENGGYEVRGDAAGRVTAERRQVP